MRLTPLNPPSLNTLPQDFALSGAPSTIERLWQWADAGWLRRMDAAFAQWVAAGDPHCHASLPLLVAILSALEGRGHSCVALPGLQAQLAALLDWPTEHQAQAALAWLKAQLPVHAAGWQAVLRSPLIEEAGALAPNRSDGGMAAAPLVLVSQAPHGPARLYLRRYYQFEHSTAQGLLGRVHGAVPQAPAIAAEAPHATADSASEVDTARIAQILAQLFPAETAQDSGAGEPAAPNWQKIACALALRQRLGVITGGPGTGKTYTAARLMAAALALANNPADLRIRLAAPTGKAAARLSESLQLALQELPEAIRANQALHQALLRIPAARTLHSLLGSSPSTRALRYDAANPLALDWLIVDEASMVDLEMMANLLQALPPHAHLVLLGDKDQLDSVEAGAVLGDVCEDAQQGHYSAATMDYLERSCGERLPAAYWHRDAAPAPALSQAIAMLRVSRRFGGMIGQLALAVQANDAQRMGALMGQLQQQSAAQRAVFWKEPATVQDAQALAWGADGPHAASGYAELARHLKAMPAWPAAYQRPAPSPPELDPAWQARHAQWVQQLLDALAHFRILCATRQGPWGVEGMNDLVIQALREAGLPVKNQGWFTGRVVMVTRNDAALGIFNGDVGIALPAAHNRQQLRVYFPHTATAQPAHGEVAPPTQAMRSIAVSRLQHAQTAFAMTVHKSQGSEFAHVMLCLPAYDSPLLTRELLYTGLTRAKKHFSYVSPRVGAWQQAMGQSTLRTSGLVDLLYGCALA